MDDLSSPNPAQDPASAASGPGTASLPAGPSPAGPAAPYPAAATGTPRAPSWVVPMIVLALVAGLGIGLAVGLLVGNRDGSDQAATTTAAPATSSTGAATTAGPTTTGPATTAAWGPADAYGAAVQVTGDALPVLPETGQDGAVGLPIPQITGTDFAGNTVTIAANGKPKIILGLAHWCPYCNEEVPIIRDWYAAGVPEGVEIISLHVYSNPNKAHFPPAAWVREVGWNIPLIADDEDRTLEHALGIPAVPFWLVVGADGTVLERATGLVQADVVDRIAEELAGAATTTTAP